MTRMTGSDCVVMCNLINTHTHMYTHTHQRERERERMRERENTGWERGREWGQKRESSSGDGNGDGNRNGNGNEDRIGEGGEETKKRKKPHKSCRHHVRIGETWVERKNNLKKRVGPVVANPDNLENKKEAGGRA